MPSSSMARRRRTCKVKSDLVVAARQRSVPAVRGLSLRAGGRGGRSAAHLLRRHAHRCQTARSRCRSRSTEVPDAQPPLKATLRVEVYEFGGRPVIESVDLPVREKPLYLGIKPLFADEEVPEGSNAAVRGDRARRERTADGGGAELHYRLVREEWDYDWFYSRQLLGLSRRRSATAMPAPAAATVGEPEPAPVSEPVQWGNYRLEVYDPASGAASSMRFHAGWSAKPGSGESPDRLQVVSRQGELQGRRDGADPAARAVRRPGAGRHRDRSRARARAWSRSRPRAR